MNKKTLIIIGILVLVVGAIVFFLSANKKVKTSASPSPTLLPTLLPSPTFFEPSKYQGLIYSDPNGNFQISIIPSTKEYSILVLGYPFNQFRTEAENTFLTLLKISKEQACKLKVSVYTPYFANPDESGKIYSLSFCSQP